MSFSRGLFGKPPNPSHTEKVLRDLSLWDKKDNRIMTLPGGMKQRVLIAKALSHEAEFFPGMPKSWGYTWMINDEKAPTGRPAGELAWAGLANLYYWIDRKNGIGGMWGTQILPFVDEVSVPGYLNFETAVYKNAV